jgi:hypothetical protein
LARSRFYAAFDACTLSVARKNSSPLALEQTTSFATLPCVTIASPDCLPDVRDQLDREGFVFAEAASIRNCLAQSGALDDWASFADSWNDLAVDTYLADYGRYRRRRHAVFTASNSNATDARAIVRAENQPHYQSLKYNPLQGDIERWFEPITPDVAAGSSLQTILRFCDRIFGNLAPQVREWRIEVHQFRIEARPDEPGQPTPEGVHRDGVDYVLVLMVRRTNIAQGTTTIHSLDGTLLGSFTLVAPFDAALVDDARVYHGVTPVQPIDPELPAHRDVLVVTFKRSDG